MIRVLHLILLLLLTGCGSPKYVAVFVDGSGSAKKNKELFIEELRALQAALNPGDRILVARITDESLTAFRPVVSRQLPSFEFWQDNTRAHAAELKAARAEIRKELDVFFDNTQWSSRTDILNSMTLVRKIFGDTSSRKVLVIMSDMIEDSRRYNFERIRLTDDTIKQIIEEQRAADLLPDLRGVEVFVTGATAPTAEKAHQIERFWRTYFAATGAALPENQYSPTLLVTPD